MLDDLARDFLYSDETYLHARANVLRIVTDDRAVELISMLTIGMRSAYLVGRADERRQHHGVVVLATLDGLLPWPCCCARVDGYHCSACHGPGHAPPHGIAVAMSGHTDGAGDDTTVIPRVWT